MHFANGTFSNIWKNACGVPLTIMSNAQVYLRLKPLQSNKPPKGVNYYLDNIGSSLTLNGTGFLLKGGQITKKTHYFDKVYEQEDPFNNIMADLLGPSISKFLSGVNESITCLGASGSGKSFVMDKLLSMFATRLFSDTFKKQRPDNLQIQLQAFEVYGELVVGTFCPTTSVISCNNKKMD